MTKALLECQAIRFAWRVEPVLNGLDWCWLKGQHWAVLGGNGSGKSTLAALLLDRIRPNAGKLQRSPEFAADNIALIAFEEHAALMAHDQRRDDSETREDAFDAGTRVLDYLSSAYRLASDQYPSQHAFDESLQRIAKHWQLEPILEQGLRYISTGQSRRVLLAQALLRKPQCLILDNPGDGLDARAQQQLNDDISRLCSDDIAILLLVKQRREIPKGISHLLVLNQGKADYQGPIEQAPQSPRAASDQADKGEGGSQARQPVPQWNPEIPRLPDDEPLVDIQGAQVQFQGRMILRDIHWQLNPGEHTIITGPNGAGKTTLLNLLYGANDKAWAQPVSLFGQARGSGESLADIRRQFGWVNTQQQLTHLNRTPCIDVLCSGFEDKLGGSAQINDRHQICAKQWLRWLDMTATEKQHFDRLSFGQQRLLLIVRAAIKVPAILVLDEPYLGLDDAHRLQAAQLVDALIEQNQTTVLFVSHHPDDWPRDIHRELALVPHPEGAFTTSMRNISPAHP